MKPNILLLFTDDQRFDTIAALGNPAIRTPNLDELVARGVAFTTASIMGGSCGAVCMPSRAMLHTGRGLFSIHREGQTIPDEHVLLGEHLRRNGYETFGTGKWHNSPASYARSFSDGAEIFFGGMNDHWNVPACRFRPDGDYGEPVEYDARWGARRVRGRQCYDHIPAGRHSTDLFADATIDFLRRRPTDRPFFAYVAFMAPHDPREMPAEFLNLYRPEDIELPANFKPEHPFDNGNVTGRDEELAAFPRQPDEVRRHIAEYYAMVSHLDAAVGRIVEALKDSGEYDNTIIVFAGDNGLAVGQHGLMGKQNVYEHSVRVPLVFAGPGIPAGEQRDALCYLTDIFPTLCELTGLPTPETVEGMSLAACLADASVEVRDVLHYAYRDCQRAVRDRRYKLIEYVVGGERHTQLFDLAEDPAETNDLADDPALAETQDRLRRELRRWRTELNDTREKLGETFWSGYDAGV
ncbi:MAG: sulfatase-like hydrolase/transferase [Phycisphaerae bacterium]